MESMSRIEGDYENETSTVVLQLQNVKKITINIKKQTMRNISSYKTLSELNDVFNVEYIQDPFSFYSLIDNEQQNKGKNLYRGVKSPHYKMYSSAQRFYLENDFDIDYITFLERLYKVSDKIDNGYIKTLYEKVRDNNCFYYTDFNNGNIGQEFQVEYNPIWAYHTLQHLSECSPFLDFTDDFSTALFFASKGIDWNNGLFAYDDINNYIEIVSIENENPLFNLQFFDQNGTSKYKSLLDDIIDNTDDFNNAVSSIDIIKHQQKGIRFICYEGISKTIYGNDPNYKYSFSNENCEAQSGRLFLTSDNVNTPFENMWYDTFYDDNKPNEWPRLKAYLIHKSLIHEIKDHLINQLLDNKLVPIKKDYKDEIKKMINCHTDK